MKHSDFTIGCEFWCANEKYKCTDIGTRTIIAFKLKKYQELDPTWQCGPPYAVREIVFDEDDLEVCSIQNE